MSYIGEHISCLINNNYHMCIQCNNAFKKYDPTFPYICKLCMYNNQYEPEMKEETLREVIKLIQKEFDKHFVENIKSIQLLEYKMDKLSKDLEYRLNEIEYPKCSIPNCVCNDNECFDEITIDWLAFENSAEDHDILDDSKEYLVTVRKGNNVNVTTAIWCKCTHYSNMKNIFIKNNESITEFVIAYADMPDSYEP